MKLKINKATDLSSISVLPPHYRSSSVVSSGLGTSLAFSRSQTSSQVQIQQSVQSQPALSQGFSSQHCLMSQFSQNSQDEYIYSPQHKKVGSQERENSVRRLPPLSCSREDSQLMSSRSSNNLIRRRSSQEYKCQISDELEHRIGMIETSISRLGMILDSVQSDIMQVNKGTKEVALEMEGARQKLIVHDDSLQSMSKGQEDIKNCMDRGFTLLADQLKQIKNQEHIGEIISKFSTISEQIDNKMVKLQNDISKDFGEKMQAIYCSMNVVKQKQATPQIQGPKATSFHASPQEMSSLSNARRRSNANKICLPKTETGSWTSVKQDHATHELGNLHKRSNRITASSNHLECRVVSESDEEIDGGLSCLLKEKGSEISVYSIEEAKEETARILRKARQRKRKYHKTIIIN